MWPAPGFVGVGIGIGVAIDIAIASELNPTERQDDTTSSNRDGECDPGSDTDPDQDAWLDLWPFRVEEPPAAEYIRVEPQDMGDEVRRIINCYERRLADLSQ